MSDSFSEAVGSIPTPATKPNLSKEIKLSSQIWWDGRVWPITTVLKTVDPERGSGGSNPSPTAIKK